MVIIHTILLISILILCIVFLFKKNGYKKDLILSVNMNFIGAILSLLALLTFKPDFQSSIIFISLSVLFLIGGRIMEYFSEKKESQIKAKIN